MSSSFHNRIVILIIMSCMAIYSFGAILSAIAISPLDSSNAVNSDPTLEWGITSSIKEPVEYLSAEVIKIGDKEFVYLIGGEVNGISTTQVFC